MSSATDLPTTPEEVMAVVRLGYKSMDKDLDRCLTICSRVKSKTGDAALVREWVTGRRFMELLGAHYLDEGRSDLIVDQLRRKQNGGSSDPLYYAEMLLAAGEAGEQDEALRIAMKQLERDYKAYRSRARRPSFDQKYPANVDPPIDKLTGKDMRERDDPRPRMLESLDAAQPIVDRFGSEEDKARAKAMRADVWRTPLAD